MIAVKEGVGPEFVLLMLFVVSLLYFLGQARKGVHFKIRKIAGLDAVNEAIGRATEMGRSILYSTGLEVASHIATIASLTILSRVARRAARYGTRLQVPSFDPVVMTLAQEMVRDSFLQEGRIEEFSPTDIFYLSGEQFAYTAAVEGIMVREKPSTVFLMGYFYAESLLLAETGNAIGAIQIAGSDAVTQLPFFIVSCDYTLIGEELYAASAYLSGDPIIMSSLKAQDMSKAVIWVLMIVGGVAAFAGSPFFLAWMGGIS
ncbi:hypothetical protein H8D30_06650 [bacterium]|nr:hypothetical protein [bacterium]